MRTTVNIANGASLSGEADFGLTRLKAIVMPAAWTAAALTFQGHEDATTAVVDLFDGAAEISFAGAGGARILLLSEAQQKQFSSIRRLKVRSGTSGTPVNQGASRDLILLSDGP